MIKWSQRDPASRGNSPAINLRIIDQEQSMSAPSRRPEIRRRRTRKEKILKLRKSLAAASSETDRARFRAKLHRQGLVSPGTPLLKSE
jgi:hypothetical protein